MISLQQGMCSLSSQWPVSLPCVTCIAPAPSLLVALLQRTRTRLGGGVKHGMCAMIPERICRNVSKSNKWNFFLKMPEGRPGSGHIKKEGSRHLLHACVRLSTPHLTCVSLISPTGDVLGTKHNMTHIIWPERRQYPSSSSEERTAGAWGCSPRPLPCP